MTGAASPESIPGPILPAFATLAEYGFVRLARAKAERLARGERVIDFATGDPREETPEFIRETLRQGVSEISSYPPAAGIPELRSAATRWVQRRFGVTLDPELHLLPTNGSKEALYSVHQAVVDAKGPRPVVLIPDPAYPVYEIGARFAGAEIVRLPLREDRGFLPDLASLEPGLLQRTALLWINYPNSPTTAVAPLAFFEEAAALARRHGFWLASDEAYSEIYFGDPPPSSLQTGLDNIVVFQTLSKRSAMTGYRSGFMAGDPELLGKLRQVRPSQGVATPEFVQRAAVAAWNDDAHVEQQRHIYARKRAILEPALRAGGLDVYPSEATFYLYARVPQNTHDSELAARLLEKGVAVAPGSLFGDGGGGWVRFALVPAMDECREAAAILASVDIGAP